MLDVARVGRDYKPTDSICHSRGVSTVGDPDNVFPRCYQIARHYANKSIQNHAYISVLPEVEAYNG